MHSSPRRRALLVFVVLGLVATACGGGRGRMPSAGPAPSSAAPAGEVGGAPDSPPNAAVAPVDTGPDTPGQSGGPAGPARAALSDQDASSGGGAGAGGPSNAGPPADHGTPSSAGAVAPGSGPAAAQRQARNGPSSGGAVTTAPGPAPGARPPAGGSPAVIRLGGVFPLSGPLGSVGLAMMQGVQSVLTEANEAGGVNGARLELRVEDDQFDPVRGKALVEKLINEDKVFAFAGIFSPFTTQAALPDIRAAGVPVVSPSGSDDREFDEPLLYPVTNPCGRQMAGNVQHLIRDGGHRKLAVVYLNVEAVSNCVKQFSAVARKLGGEIVFQSATAPAAPDCASRILSARASGAEALVVIVDNLGVVKCVQAQKQQGWDVPVSISYNIVDDPTLLDGLGKAAEGLVSSSPFSGGSSPEFAAQCGAVRRYYPKAKVQFFLIVGCAGAKLLVEGLRLAGPGAGRAALQGVLDSGRVFSFGGLLPDLSYRPGRHLPYDLTATVEVKGGRWVRIGPLYTPESA